MPDASASYPFATPSDFGVAAYANNDEGMGITWNLRVRVFVNPKADITGHLLKATGSVQNRRQIGAGWLVVDADGHQHLLFDEPQIVHQRNMSPFRVASRHPQARAGVFASALSRDHARGDH